MDTRENTSPTVSSAILLGIGALVLVLGVGAYLTLVLTNHTDETDKLLAFLSPVVVAIFVIGNQQRQHAVVEQRLDQQDQQLQVVTEQTNGVLNRKIYDNTERAFVESPKIASAIKDNARAAIGEMLAEHLDGGERNGAVD
jgi:apolipoprotein N-acyltransferase